MTPAQIKHMVDRFLQWRFPADTSPDGGIILAMRLKPSGTNLFSATQATAMVKFMAEGMPADEPAPEAFKIGDVVRMKSGGVPMTVIDTRDGGFVETHWEENGMQGECFPSSLLELTPPGPAHVDIDALKDRPTSHIVLTIDDRDCISETYAAVHEHLAEMFEHFHSSDNPNHHEFERRMRRISILLNTIRQIEDEARERDRVRRNTPLNLTPDWDAVGGDYPDMHKSPGDGNT